jgi:hypothetical protein
VAEIQAELVGVAHSVSTVQATLCSAVRQAGTAAPTALDAVGRTALLQQHAGQWSDAAGAVLDCARACHEAAASAEFQLGRRAALRTDLVRIPHQLGVLRQTGKELRHQMLDSDASVRTFQRRLDFSLRVLSALEAGETALRELRARCGELLEPDRRRRLLGRAGRDRCYGASVVTKHEGGMRTVRIGSAEAGVLVVQWIRSRPEIARVYPAPALAWGTAGRVLGNCFDLEEPVRAPGTLSLVSPALALWDQETLQGELVRRGVLRWNRASHPETESP